MKETATKYRQGTFTYDRHHDHPVNTSPLYLVATPENKQLDKYDTTTTIEYPKKKKMFSSVMKVRYPPVFPYAIKSFDHISVMKVKMNRKENCNQPKSYGSAPRHCHLSHGY